ncbi:MAG: hypothetical protein EOM91_07165 [Sphingobacteriia bacterium]|nr:hypothetical protein [Sphingobacteriia bacterium]
MALLAYGVWRWSAMPTTAEPPVPVQAQPENRPPDMLSIPLVIPARPVPTSTREESVAQD